MQKLFKFWGKATWPSAFGIASIWKYGQALLADITMLPSLGTCPQYRNNFRAVITVSSSLG